MYKVTLLIQTILLFTFESMAPLQRSPLSLSMTAATLLILMGADQTLQLSIFIIFQLPPSSWFHSILHCRPDLCLEQTRIQVADYVAQNSPTSLSSRVISSDISQIHIFEIITWNHRSSSQDHWHLDMFAGTRNFQRTYCAWTAQCACDLLLSRKN